MSALNAGRFLDHDCWLLLSSLALPGPVFIYLVMTLSVLLLIGYLSDAYSGSFFEIVFSWSSFALIALANVGLETIKVKTTGAAATRTATVNLAGPTEDIVLLLLNDVIICSIELNLEEYKTLF